MAVCHLYFENITKPEQFPMLNALCVGGELLKKRAGCALFSEDSFSFATSLHQFCIEASL